MKRRNLILLLGGASSGAMSIGTGAFSSVEAERGVEVNVVDDEDAYLGLDDDAGEGLVRIKNQFAEDLALTVTAALASGSGEVEVEVDGDDEGNEEDEDEAGEDSEDDHEDAGEIEVEIGLDDEDDDSSHDDSVDVTIPTGNFLDVIAECDEAGEATLELDFSGTVSDTGTTVDKTREFSVDCGSATVSNTEYVAESVRKVKFPGGSGTVKILTTENNGGGGSISGSVSAKLYCKNDGEITSSDYTDVSVNESLDSSSFDGDCEGSVVGVKIKNVGIFEKSDRGSANVVDKQDARDQPSWE